MTVQEALDKAVEGGYHIYGSDGMDPDYEGATHDYSAWTRKDNESSFIVPTEETFLEPQFWQALGRALGWSETCDLFIICVHGAEECQRCRGYYWMYQWHRFIQTWRMATPRKPSLPFSPRRSSCLVEHSTGTRLNSMTLSTEHPRGGTKGNRHWTTATRLHGRHAPGRQCSARLPK